MKFKHLKRKLLGFCATIIAMSSFVTSVGAVDTSEAEIEYSLMYLDKFLPKDGNMDEFKDLSQYGSLNKKRLDLVKHKDGPEEKVEIDEEKVYDEIKDTVQKLIDKVDERTPGHPKYKGKSSGNLDKSRNWRIAKAIYRWVTEHIRYDRESKENDENGKKSFRKPQDALFVFAETKGVCQGYADLIKVMMRLAGIPCVGVSTLGAKDSDAAHIYNAIYLDDPKDANKKGWALLDASNGSPLYVSDDPEESYQKTSAQKKLIKEFFPAFYEDLPIDAANRVMIKKEDHKISLIVGDMHGDCEKMYIGFNYDRIVYFLGGVETDAFIHIVDGNLPERLRKDIEIPDEMLKLGLKFKIGKGIESIKLKGDEEFLDDLSQATDLKSVDTTRSNNYSGYDKNTKQFIPKFVKKSGQTDEGVNYTIVFDSTSNNAVEILCGDSSSDKKYLGDFKIPEFLKKYNVPIKIQPSITSLILEGDDTVDLSRAKNLKKVDVSNSNKYIVSEGILYEKNAENNDLRGNAVCILKHTGKFEKIHYMIQASDDNNSNVEQIFLLVPCGKVQNVKIPKFLTQFKIPIQICGSIESIILGEDDIVDLSVACDLKSVDVTNSRRYEKRNDKLFDKVENKEILLRDGINIIDTRSK